MPSFDFTSLLWWGLPLAAAPVIIHLINLLRHRRVEWAAMEFLLASQRKYRTRVLLKQLLLLALRVAAVAGIVLALAQPRWTAALGGWLGGARTVHLVLLDDSYSMGEVVGAGDVGGDAARTCFDRGRRVVERIVAELAGRRGRQEVALGRFSRLVDRPAPQAATGPLAEGGQPAGAGASANGAEPAVAAGGADRAAAAADATADGRLDLPRQPVSPAVVQRIRERIARFTPSATAAGPTTALGFAAGMLGGGAGGGEPRVLWLVSDFRATNWRGNEEAVATLAALAADGVELRLVDCAGDDAAEPGAGGAGVSPANLSVERLEVVGGVPATGVLVPLEVTVANRSDRPVRDLAIDVREDGVQRPGLRLPEVPAGGTAAQRLEVRFAKPGPHTVDVRLPPDRLPGDDLRTAVVDVVDRVDVLVVDGRLAAAPGAAPTAPGAPGARASGRAGDAFYLAAALAPGAGAPTGLRPRIEPPAALASLELSSFDCVWLLDVERLDNAERDALEAYVRGGGGAVFFTGPRTRAEWVNDVLYRGGEGLFPLPLAGAVDLLADPAAPDAPDVVVEEHPVVAVLAGQRNPFVGAVRVERYMAAQRGHEPDAGLRRLLSLRNGAPLVVERPCGAGVVVAVLTTAAPEWNSWARGNPSWVVVMLELESHLARARRAAAGVEVGAPVAVELEPGVDGVEVDFLVPPDGALVHQTAVPATDGRLVARLERTDAPGAYGIRWKRVDGSERERMVAVNVDPDEGRLERAGRERIDTALAGIPFRYEPAAAFQGGAESLAGVSLVAPLLQALAVVMLLEQLLAWSASYHPISRRRTA